MRFSKLISLSIAITFLTSNISWAGDHECAYKLAAQARVAELSRLPLNDLGQLLKGNSVLEAEGITNIETLLEKLDSLKRKGVIGFPYAEKQDAGKIAKYIFIKDGLFLRVTNRGEVVNDDVYSLLKLHGVKEDVGSYTLELCEVTKETEDSVNAILKSINSAWSVKAFVEPVRTVVISKETRTDVNGGENKSHLFPKYIAEALGKKLQELGWAQERIKNVLTYGVTFYITDPSKPVPINYAKEGNVATDREAVIIVAEVLMTELKIQDKQKAENARAAKAKEKPKDLTITENNVLAVLNLHEDLHKVIATKQQEIVGLLQKLKDYYAEVLKKDKDSKEVEAEVNKLLCAFARNYNYLPDIDLINSEYVALSQQQQLALVEELLVHEYVERHFFRQPVRIIDMSNRREDLSQNVERIFFRGLTPETTVELFAAIKSLSMPPEKGLMKRYFVMLYKLYLEAKKSVLKIRQTFYPSALLSDAERRDKLGAIEYGSSEFYDGISEEDCRSAAGQVRLILNGMDGGVGNEVQRQDYLKAKGKTGKFGAKGADIEVFVIDPNPATYDEVSIMEAKFLRAIMDFEEKKYRAIEYCIMGSPESAESFAEILKKKMFDPKTGRRTGQTYEDYLNTHPNFKVVAVQEGIKVPAIDLDRESLSAENLGHGNHGIRGAWAFQEAVDHEVGQGESVVRTIYNGDGINNGVDPIIVGWMAKKKVPVVMITTTKMGIDKKGGQIGLEISADGERVQIMELAQAKSVGQEKLFGDTGLRINPDKQYFNTNTVLMNVSVLQAFFEDLISNGIITIDDLRDAMKPVLTTNIKEVGDKRFVQLEGALGSVVLSLAGYFDTHKDPRVRELMDKHFGKGNKFLRIVNIGKDKRSVFFTPFKESSDYWFLFKSGWFTFDRETMRLRNNFPGKGNMPRFELANSYFDKKNDPGIFKEYYKNISNILTVFEGTDVFDLDLLEIPMKPVIFGKDIKLEGRVAVLNLRSVGDAEQQIADLQSADLKAKLKEQGIQEQNGKLVLKDVCIVIGDTDIFISRLTDEDGDLGSRYFSRLIYQFKDRGEIVPPILYPVTEKVHDRMDRDPINKGMADIRNDNDAKNYIKTTARFDNPKYDRQGMVQPFDGVSVICRVPSESSPEFKLRELIDEIKDRIGKWQAGAGRKLVADIARGTEQFTICNGVSVLDWKTKYEEELNKETKDEIVALRDKLIAQGEDPEKALEKATYAVVVKRIIGALKDFQAWGVPHFVPERVALFPPEDFSPGKTAVVLTMVPKTMEDMAIVTKMRDAIEKATGITDFIDFKRHITLGYFVDGFSDLKEYNSFRNLIEKYLNNVVVKSRRQERAYSFVLPNVDLSYFADMESFITLASFAWDDVSLNRSQGDLSAEDSLQKIADVKERADKARGPIAAPIGKKVQEGKYAEFMEIEVTNNKLSEGREIGEGKNNAKYGQIDIGMLNRVLKVLTSNNLGLLGVIDAIRIVDNIPMPQVEREAGVSTLPYGAIKKEGDRIVLLLDVDAFRNEKLLHIVLSHDLNLSIMKIVPYIDDATRELVANLISLKLALEFIEKGELDLEEFIKDISGLGADLQFLLAVEVLSKEGIKSNEDDKIVAVAIEHMYSMPYYAGLFETFEFAADWRSKITGSLGEASTRYRDALRIFNDIAGAKELAAKVKELAIAQSQARGILAKVSGLSQDAGAAIEKVTKKIKMLTSRWSIDAGFLDKLHQAGKFIRLDVDELLKTENKYVTSWLKGLTQQQQGVFVFYSGSGKEDVSRFIADNNLVGQDYTELTAKRKVEMKDIITLVDLSGADTEKPLADGKSLYLPYLYSITGIYLAAQIVVAEGDVAQIQDNLIRTTLVKTYEALFGETLSPEDLNKLFRGQWPKAYKITDSINALRQAIVQIEIAA